MNSTLFFPPFFPALSGQNLQHHAIPQRTTLAAEAYALYAHHTTTKALAEGRVLCVGRIKPLHLFSQ
jgi:hypothetical protein